MRLLILIIANDFEPYNHLQKHNWDKFIELNPDIDCFYLKENPNLCTEYKIDGNNFYYRVNPSIGEGIIKKTIYGLKYLDFNKYDFILRTNLSSFYIRNRLEIFLKTLPKEGVYSGALCLYNNIKYTSGSGFIMSKDVCEYLISNESSLNFWVDDVIIGQVLTQKFKLLETPIFDYFNQESDISRLSSNCFQIRVKHYPERDLEKELRVFEMLYKMFYP